jgi:hypothetical protein
MVQTKICTYVQINFQFFISLSAISHQPSAISHQPSAISHQPKPIPKATF